MYMDPEMYDLLQTPVDSVARFFDVTLREMEWTKENEEVVLDVGCGPGSITINQILPLFPNLKRLFAVDLLPSMIEFATAHYGHPKVEYSQANIEEWSSIEKWKGQITKVVSIHCFHWVKDQRQAFSNVLQVLQPGGYAAFFLCLHTSFFQAVVEIAKDPEWIDYFKGVDSRIPESHIKKYDASHYSQMLKEIGFTIVYCKSEMKLETFPSDDVYRNFYASLCVLVPYIPVDRREEFKDNFFQILLKMNGRNKDGLPLHYGTMLELVVQKC